MTLEELILIAEWQTQNQRYEWFYCPPSLSAEFLLHSKTFKCIELPDNLYRIFYPKSKYKLTKEEKLKLIMEMYG